MDQATTAKAQTAVVATPEIDTSTAAGTSAGDATESIHRGHVVGGAGNGRQEPRAAGSEPAAVARNGHVVGHAGNGRQDTAGAASDLACTAKTADGKPSSCPKAINKAGIK